MMFLQSVMRFHHLLVVMMMAGSMVIFNFNNFYLFFAVQHLNDSKHNFIRILIVLFLLLI